MMVTLIIASNPHVRYGRCVHTYINLSIDFHSDATPHADMMNCVYWQRNPLCDEA
jgi:hypothetical protein